MALCADDYALHEGVDDAVCALLAQRGLTAVSCMSGAPRWHNYAAPRLREMADGAGAQKATNSVADIGLHLNLTESFGQQDTSLAGVIVKSYTRRLDREALRTRFARQFDAFEDGMGRTPDFIDGHQHVHQFPVVRDIVLELIASRYGERTPWVRSTLAGSGLLSPKQALLGLLGGWTLARRLRAANILTNAGFAGVYGFDSDDYAGLFEQWLLRAREGMLLMCHPAISSGAHDPIGCQRQREYGFFSSDAFATMLAARGVRLVRLSSLLAPACHERHGALQDFSEPVVNQPSCTMTNLDDPGTRMNTDAR
ncbi:MAG: ChbG/HpnK family deacetylase [Massilia sp.]|nr:ChbG/HpnK family deacetylase [Massilia sp.]